jgi:hypothetical protein
LSSTTAAAAAADDNGVVLPLPLPPPGEVGPVKALGRNRRARATCLAS